MSFKQNIHIDRQTFVCIINVNSSNCEKECINSHSSFEKESSSSKKSATVNLCETESNQSGIVRKPLRLSSRCYSRVPPACLRNRCQRRCHHNYRNASSRRHRNVNQSAHHHKYARRSRMYLRETRPPVCEHKRNTNNLLSPISSSPFKDDLDYQYEDISTDSFDKIVEKPLSYKNGNNHICIRKSENKLDTLIRRTKERERRLVEQSRRKRFMSPGFFSNVSSEECLYSSISDVSTFILERSQQESERQNFAHEMFQDFTHKYPNFTHDKCPNFTHEKCPNFTHDECPNFTHEKCPNFTHEKCPNFTHKYPNFTHDKCPNFTHEKPQDFTHEKPQYFTDDNCPNLQHGTYSNFSQQTCKDIKTEVNSMRNCPYSTSSPKDDFFPKFENFKIEEFESEQIDKYDVEIGVKSEPMVDIGTYSPITDYFPSISVKLEPKLNPNMTWIDDGIAMTDYDD